jgi:uncharacterized membrane protein (Fun14 family)
MSAEALTSIPATIGGGFIGGLLLGFAIKKVVKLIAVIVGLFILGLAYLQYQQLAYFDWNKIERMITAIFGNVTGQIFSNQEDHLNTSTSFQSILSKVVLMMNSSPSFMLKLV